MARTQKWTTREGAADGRYFTHNGHANCDPTKVKKGGAGSHNWGRPGDEIDHENYHMFGQSKRRNSNHSHNVKELQLLNDEIERSLQM